MPSHHVPCRRARITLWRTDRAACIPHRTRQHHAPLQALHSRPTIAPRSIAPRTVHPGPSPPHRASRAVAPHAVPMLCCIICYECYLYPMPAVVVAGAACVDVESCSSECCPRVNSNIIHRVLNVYVSLIKSSSKFRVTTWVTMRVTGGRESCPGAVNVFVHMRAARPQMRSHKLENMPTQLGTAPGHIWK